MNGIEKITGKIIEEANIDAKKIIDEAKADAEKIISRYKEKAVSAAAEIEDAGSKQAKAQEMKYSSNAGLEARKTLLIQKQELLTEAFDKALVKLRSMPKDKYIDLLAKLAANAAQTGEEEVIFSSEDKEQYGKEVIAEANKLLKAKGLTGGLKISSKVRPILGGVIIASGDVEINCALDGLVRMEKDNLSAQVAQILFS
ncbi:MAG: V-type ATP synthase subunit E [Eubacteriaceae bacterium]|nr:V-type ATP synthase subunit E [Eubacteriaceae bacterium]